MIIIKLHFLIALYGCLVLHFHELGADSEVNFNALSIHIPNLCIFYSVHISSPPFFWGKS